MSDTAAEAPATWPVLNVNERRVLGVLIEKAKTTPDAYPMSLNALTTGCNQKSNRDPLLDLNIADGLLKVLVNRSLRDSLRAAGQERARAFTWDRCAARTVAAYEQAAA